MFWTVNKHFIHACTTKDLLRPPGPCVLSVQSPTCSNSLAYSLYIKPGNGNPKIAHFWHHLLSDHYSYAQGLPINLGSQYFCTLHKLNTSSGTCSSISLAFIHEDPVFASQTEFFFSPLQTFASLSKIRRQHNLWIVRVASVALSGWFLVLCTIVRIYWCRQKRRNEYGDFAVPPFSLSGTYLY